MPRLSGAPADIINSNGLAFVILTILPFIHFWASGSRSVARWLVYLSVAGLCGYALVLTGSRSGIVGLGVVLLGFIWLSKRRWLAAVLVIGVVVYFLSGLESLQQQRFQSLYRDDVVGSETAHGRIEGVKIDFGTALAAPLFGFGLGTSLEASANVTGS